MTTLEDVKTILSITGLDKIIPVLLAVNILLTAANYYLKPQCPQCGRKMKGHYFTERLPIYTCKHCHIILDYEELGSNSNGRE